MCEDLWSVWYILLIPTLFILEFRPWPTVVWSSFHLVHAESIHVFQRAQIGHGRIYYQYHLIVLRFCAYTSTCPLLYVMTMYIFFLTLKLRGIPLYSSVVSDWSIFFYPYTNCTLCTLLFASVAEQFDWSVGTLQQEPWLTCCWNPRQQPFWLPGISFMCSVTLNETPSLSWIFSFFRTVYSAYLLTPTRSQSVRWDSLRNILVLAFYASSMDATVGTESALLSTAEARLCNLFVLEDFLWRIGSVVANIASAHESRWMHSRRCIQHRCFRLAYSKREGEIPHWSWIWTWGDVDGD